MSKNKSKTKGNKFELDIANYLTKNFNESFTRVPNSGAFIGGKNQERKHNLSANQIQLFKGDIIAPDSMTNLVIECKHYKEFPFYKLIGDDKIRILDEWISEVEYDAEKNDIWLLIWKISNQGTYVLWDEELFFSITCQRQNIDMEIPFCSKTITYNYRYRIMPIDKFFEEFTSFIRKIPKNNSLDNDS